MLKGICIIFLWGKNEVGAQKRSLVAWKNIVCKKAEGGLGIEPFKDQSLALKLFWCTRFFTEPDVMWVKFANCSISHCLANGQGCRTKKLWTVVEGLVLDEDLHISASPFLHDLIRGFNEAKHSLCFVEDGASLPGHTSMEQILLLFGENLCLSAGRIRSIKGILCLHNVNTLADFKDEDNLWKTLDLFCRSSKPSRLGDD